MELEMTIKPRPELAPDWCEVRLDDALFLDTDFPAGTRLQAGTLELETIEDAVPGSPVMCRIVKEHWRAAELLWKYAQEPEPSIFARLVAWIRRRKNGS